MGCTDHYHTPYSYLSFVTIESWSLFSETTRLEAVGAMAKEL